MGTEIRITKKNWGCLIPFIILAIVIIGVRLKSHFQKSKEVDLYIQEIQSSDNERISNALVALQEMGIEAAPAIPSLIDILGDTTPLSKNAISTILGSKAFFSSGKGIVSPEHYTIGYCAAIVLGQIVSSPYDETYVKNIRAYSKANKKISKAAISLLKQSDYHTRMNALIVLNFAVREEAIEHIASCLKDERPDIRIRAALNLIAYKAKYNMDSVIEPLSELLNDNDPNVRMVAESVLSYVAK